MTNPNQSLVEAKALLIKDVKRFLESNIEDVRKNNYKIKDTTRIGSGEEEEMFADFIVDKVCNKYMPTTYDNIILWTKEEPLLIEKTIHPCCIHEESSILAIIRSNIYNYLKSYVYGWVRAWLTEMRGQ